MPFPNPDTQFQPGTSGNPEGKKPGTKHLSTHIQEMLNDPDFEIKLKDGSLLKERPIQAIIKTAVAKSISGDNRWAEWLAKHGYGEKLFVETSVATQTREKIKDFLDDTSDYDDASSEPTAADSTEARGEVADAPTDIS